MKFLLFDALTQSFLLLFLLAKDKNNGERTLFREQKWGAPEVMLLVLSINALKLLLYYLPTNPSVYHAVYQLILKKNPRIFHACIFLLLESIILFLLFKFRIRNNISILGITKNKLWRNFILGLVVGVVICFFTQVLIDFFRGPEIRMAKEIRNLDGMADYISYFFAMVIFGPIVEEIIYRGLLYSPYKKKYGPMKAIIITSVFFSVIHLNVGPGRVFIYGIVLGSLYETTESIVPSMVAHSVSNLIAIFSVIYFLR